MEDKSIYNKKKTGRKTRQKGFGWYSSLNPNAGDVEKSIEVFNNAQPDGGIGAVSSTSGSAMGESLQMSDGMVEDDFFTFERDNITYHFFFTPGRRTENKYAILAVDYGIRFDKEPFKNEKGATVIPMSRVHDKPQQKGYFEFTSESHPELVDAMEEEDRKEYRDLVVAEMAKHMDINESVNIPNDVEMFYDRHLRLWTLYIKDEEGNQVSNTEYAPTKEEALYIANNKGLFNMREALKEPNLEDLSWLDNLHDVLSSILNGQNKDKELEQRLKDAYYKNYPWDTEEWGPFNPEDTSWVDATFDAIKEYNGMDQFWTDIKDALYSDLTEATYYNQPEGSWNRDNSAELDAERKDRESHKDTSKRVKIIDPKDYNKYKTGTIGEVFINRHGDEIYRVKLDDDVQDRYIPFKKEQLKFIGNESINEGLYGYQTFIKTGERGKPIYTLTYGQSDGFIVRYNKNDYLLTFGKEWENHIKAILEWLKIYQPNYFVKKYEDGSISSFTPSEAEAIEYIREEIKRGLVLTEATASTKYSYTGPIYHLGNKIAEKSKLYTMAKSWKQAKNNFLYKIANGDIVGHYDLVDEFIKEVPKATLDTPAIEEKPEIVKCEICGTQLNPMGECPVCDYGEDDLLESIHIDSNLDALSQLNRMEEIV